VTAKHKNSRVQIGQNSKVISSDDRIDGHSTIGDDEENRYQLPLPVRYKNPSSQQTYNNVWAAMMGTRTIK